MRKLLHTLVVLGLTAPVSLFAVASRAGDLEMGDLAPEFSLPGSDGQTYTLADFRDKQVVVLAWFPKAFTGG